MNGRSTMTSSNANKGRTTIRVNTNNRNGWAALVDRGANGGIAGSDTRIIDPELEQGSIDLCGIDNHTVRNLRIVTVGAVAKSNWGEVIIILHQQASMPDGKTILSCGQMEHYKVKVNDKSPAITKTTPTITTVEGCVIPISFINGLPYLKIRPYTDSEWASLIHVHLTEDKEWDPRILDARISDEWYLNQPNVTGSTTDSMFDLHGELKEEVVQSQDPNEVDDGGVEERDKKRTGRREIEAHLHHLIADELQSDFYVYSVGHKVYEVDFDEKQHAPRRSQRKSAKKPVKYFDTRPKKKKEPNESKDGKGPETGSSPGGLSERKTLDKDPFEAPLEPIAEPTIVLGYNNPAKTSEADPGSGVWEGGHKKLKPQPKTLRKLERYFPGIPTETIKRTFEATTQYGRIGAVTGTAIRSRIKAPNPALNVPRRNEAVGTDTVYGPMATPAVDDGSTCAQIFVGRTSTYTSVHPSGHSDAQFVKCLQDEIRKRGAMRMIISDRARAEVSEKVKDVLRTYGIDDWQSEPYKHNQNYAERAWKDLKEKTNTLLNYSGAPQKTWLLALKLIAWIHNHVALERLGWRTPFEWLFGYTPDISVLLQFIFWEPVYYPAVEPRVGDTPELLGRYVGISEHVGHAMTYLILSENDKIVSRSDVRTATKDGVFVNRRAEESAPGMAPKPHRMELLSPFTQDDVKNVVPGHPRGSTLVNDDIKIELTPTTVQEDDEPETREQDDLPTSLQDEKDILELFPGGFVPSADNIGEHYRVLHSFTEAHNHEGRPMPTIDVGSLRGRTFISNPDSEGEQHRSKVIGIEPIGEETADGREALYKFKCSVKDKVFEEVITYNQMLEWCNRDMDRNDMYRFNAILDHKWDGKTRTWWVLVEWDSGEVTWNTLNDTWAGDAVTVSMYAKRNGLLHTDGWKRCKRLAKNSKTLARMANQTRLKNFRNRPAYKFGYQVARNHAEAMWIDEKNGTTKFADAEAFELKQLQGYDSFKDLGKGAPVPEGYKAIPCHFVYDVKHDGRHKARFVAGGHRTDTPVDSVYSSVTSLEGIRIITLIAELNDLSLWSTDVGNAYLYSFTTEKVVFYAGPEFGELEGHLFVIVKALYGLKSSGKRWHDRLFDVLRGMNFTPSKAEDDIWMRDMGDHYEYIAVYVDDLLIASKNPQAIIDSLESVPFALKGTGPVSFHLGCDYFRDEDGTLCVGPKTYIERMVGEYERLFGVKPSTKARSPLEPNDHPELDTSPILDEDGVRKYQSLIGTLQWAITLGRFDIATAVMTMSSFRVAPREGHLDRVKRICGYLSKYKSGFIRIRTEEPDYSSLPKHKYDWARTCYAGAKEEIPRDAPTPKGKRVVLTTYKDANLYHDLASGKAVTGALHFINQTPVSWYSRKQETVETATYGSEFVAARKAIQQIMGLRLTLRYLGVPIHGSTYLFGDNESVVKSGSIPDSRLAKRHLGLSYHFTREAIASEMVSFHHIPGQVNPADVLSKHWAHSQIWTALQPMMFWSGNTGDLLDRA